MDGHVRPTEHAGTEACVTTENPNRKVSETEQKKRHH